MSAKNHHVRIPHAEKLAAPIMVLIGALSLITATFYESYILAFIGLALTFWGALLFYIATKHVSLDFLNATALSALQNVERILTNEKTEATGVYLPPNCLPDYKSSLVFVPLQQKGVLPRIEETDEGTLNLKEPAGIVLTPPGFLISRLLEQKLGVSFAQLSLEDLLEKLPNLLIEKTAMAEKVELTIEGNIIKVEVSNGVFGQLCAEMKNLPKTHEILGCPFTSAIACALAKSSGKPITIQEEEQVQDGKITKVRFGML